MELYDLKQMYETGANREEILGACRTMLSETGVEACGEKLAFLAADFAHPEALALLFEAGVSPALVGNYGFTLLHTLALQELSRYCEKPPGAVAASTALLLDHGASALRKDENEGLTCYHYAARNGMYEMVETLARRGTKLNMTDKDGNTGIYIAAYYVKNALHALPYAQKAVEDAKQDYEETRRRLLARDMSEEQIAQYIKTNVRRTPEVMQREYEAAVNLVEGYFRVVKAFASGGVDVDEKNSYGQTALDMAVKNDAKKIAAFLSGALTGDGDKAAIAAGGMTPHQAAEKGDLEAIRAIAATGADMNGLNDTKEYFGACTPLAVAAAYLKPEAVTVLLECGADPSFKDGKGYTALSYLFHSCRAIFDRAVFEEKWIPRMIKDMVEAGMDFNATVNDSGDTLLTLACKSSRSTGYAHYSLEGVVIEEALKYKADINHANSFGETALMHVSGRDLDTMENIQITLLEQGASVSAADRNGDTALHYAARNRDKRGAKVLSDMLLEFGADPRTTNNAGQTALDIATGKDNEPLVKLLLSKM